MSWPWTAAIAVAAAVASWAACSALQQRRRRSERIRAWGDGWRAAAGVADDLPAPVDLGERRRGRGDAHGP